MFIALWYGCGGVQRLGMSTRAHLRDLGSEWPRIMLACLLAQHGIQPAIDPPSKVFRGAVQETSFSEENK